MIDNETYLNMRNNNAIRTKTPNTSRVSEFHVKQSQKRHSLAEYSVYIADTQSASIESYNLAFIMATQDMAIDLTQDAESDNEESMSATSSPSKKETSFQSEDSDALQSRSSTPEGKRKRNDDVTKLEQDGKKAKLGEDVQCPSSPEKRQDASTSSSTSNVSAEQFERCAEPVTQGHVSEAEETNENNNSAVESQSLVLPTSGQDDCRQESSPMEKAPESSTEHTVLVTPEKTTEDVTKQVDECGVKDQQQTISSAQNDPLTDSLQENLLAVDNVVSAPPKILPPTCESTSTDENQEPLCEEVQCAVPDKRGNGVVWFFKWMVTLFVLGFTFLYAYTKIRMEYHRLAL